MKMETKNRVTQVTPKKEAFLKNYTLAGTVKGAAEATGITRKTVYEWLKVDGVFSEGYERAKEDVTDDLEREARRRAYEGQEKPIIRDGEVVGTYTVYSDTLLIFLLKGNRPDKYRERLDTHVSGDSTLNILVRYANRKESDALQGLGEEEAGDKGLNEED